MQVNWQQFSEHLTKHHNIAINIYSVSSIAGGDINQAFHLHTSEGDFFLKVNSLNQYDLLFKEANNLNTLAGTFSITVPKVFAYGKFAQTSWLLLEYLPLSSKGDDIQRGKDLALLHHHLFDEKKYGWFEDNYIGTISQKNNWQDCWVAFYAENRLQAQLDLAIKNSANSQLVKQVEELIKQLPRFFQNYSPKPSYLHGDLWGGNSSFLSDGSAVFYDPASYIGDRETDLAMSEIFGGFSPSFYKGYNQVFPIDKGYQQRKNLYHVYHYLNHYNMFAGSYDMQALRCINSCLASL